MAAQTPGAGGLMFWLGTHQPNWLAAAGVPLCVARQRLEQRRTFPRAIAPWILDSGAFTEISRNGQWTITPRHYTELVRRFRDEIGQMAWAAPMDWMCEPFILERTGRWVTEHMILTVNSYLELRMIAADLPFIPVLQGWTADDYLRCADLYAAAGIDLAAEPVVGLGSVCRRQDTAPAAHIVRSLAPLRLHGFGVKVTGLRKYGQYLTSADSLAWSYNARKNPPMAGCAHASCANCLRRANWWRDRLLTSLKRGWQLDLFGPGDWEVAS
jgi:hypothetical protein